MGATIDKGEVQAALERAIRRADSGDVSALWSQRTEHLGESPSQSMVTVLGIAMLARATYGKEIDPLALQRSAGGPRGYSGRSVGAVLAENQRAGRYHPGVTGPDALNNNPFNKQGRIDTINVAALRRPSQPYMSALQSYASKLDQLDAAEAESALAAFIAVRRRVFEEAMNAREAELQARTGVALPALGRLAQQFVQADAEGGRRAEALTAAALDCVFSRVLLGSTVNDPDPFDVKAWRGRDDLVPSTVAQVKQKPVTEEVAVKLAEDARDQKVTSAILVAIAPNQLALNLETIASRTEPIGVATLVVTAVPTLLASIAIFGSASPERVGEVLPSAMRRRLVELGARRSSVEQWRGLVAQFGG